MASPGEKKVFEYFKQLIINTSLPRLTSSAEHDNKTILSQWNSVINCSNVLSLHRNVQWSALNTTWTEKKDDLWDCRERQSQSNTSNTACSNCQGMVDQWDPPATALPAGNERVPVFHTTATAEASALASYGDDRKFTTLTSWFTEYHNFHCTTRDCPAPMSGHGTWKDCHDECTAACTTEIIENGNQAENCSQLQGEFEVATCNWNDDITSSCQQFEDCKADHDPVYNTTIAQTHESSRRREVEYQIMKTIVCFIDLLTSDTRPTLADKQGCQKQWPMDMFTLYYPHVEYQTEDATVYIPGSSDCTFLNYPAPASGCPAGEVHTHHYSDSIPCTNFVEQYYQSASWYSSAPPDACNPCSSSQ